MGTIQFKPHIAKNRKVKLSKLESSVVSVISLTKLDTCGILNFFIMKNDFFSYFTKWICLGVIFILVCLVQKLHTFIMRMAWKLLFELSCWTANPECPSLIIDQAATSQWHNPGVALSRSSVYLLHKCYTALSRWIVHKTKVADIQLQSCFIIQQVNKNNIN